MVQDERAAAQEPRHKRQADTGEGGWSQRRLDDLILRDAAFEQYRETARQQFGVAARDRHNTAFADIEGDGRDMGGRVAPNLLLARRRRIEIFRREQIGERHHAIREILSEAAHVADGKHVGRHRHGGLSLVERADAIAGDQHLRPDARERRDRIGTAVKQRQRRDDHSRPQHRKRRQKTCGDIGQLNADDRVGGQPHVAQARGNGRHDAVGFRVGEPIWAAIGESGAIGRIGERESVGTAQRLAVENAVEGEGGPA